MGACVSTNQQLLNEINKPENRKFILENLNLTQQDLINAINNTNNNKIFNSSPLNELNFHQINSNYSSKHDIQSSQNQVAPSTSFSSSTNNTFNNAPNCKCNCACHHCKKELSTDRKSYNSLVFKIIAFDENNDLTVIDSNKNENQNSSDLNLNECLSKLKKNNRNICLLLNTETNSLNIITKSANLNNLINNSSSDDNFNKNDDKNNKKAKIKVNTIQDFDEETFDLSTASNTFYNKKSIEASIPNYIKEKNKLKNNHNKKSVNTQTSYEIYPDFSSSHSNENNRLQHNNLVNKFPSSNSKSTRTKSPNGNKSIGRKKQIHFNENDLDNNQNRSKNISIYHNRNHLAKKETHLCSNSNEDKVIDIVQANDSDKIKFHNFINEEEDDETNINEIDDFDGIALLNNSTEKKKILKPINKNSNKKIDLNKSNKVANNNNFCLNKQKQFEIQQYHDNNDALQQFEIKSDDVCRKCHKNNYINLIASSKNLTNSNNENRKANNKNELSNKKSNRVHFLNNIINNKMNNENSNINENNIIEQKNNHFNNQQHQLDLFYKRDINYDFYNNNYNLYNTNLLNNQSDDKYCNNCVSNLQKTAISSTNSPSSINDSDKNKNDGNIYIQYEDEEFVENNYLSEKTHNSLLAHEQKIENFDNDVNDIDAYLDNYGNQYENDNLLLNKKDDVDKLSDILKFKKSLNQMNKNLEKKNNISKLLEEEEALEIKDNKLISQEEEHKVLEKTHNNKLIKYSHKFNSFYDNVNDDLIIAKRDDDNSNQNNNNNNTNKSPLDDLNQKEIEESQKIKEKNELIIESNNLIINIQQLSDTYFDKEDNNKNKMNENNNLNTKNGAACIISNEDQKDSKLKSSSNTTINSFFNNKIDIDSSILIMECDKTQDNDQMKLDDSMNSVISNVFNKSDEDEISKTEDNNIETITKLSKSSSLQSTPSDKPSPLVDSVKDEFSNADSSIDSAKLNKLKLNSIVNAVGFFMFPSASLINLALKGFLIEHGLYDLFE
jgi:hypothetical protein